MKRLSIFLLSLIAFVALVLFLTSTPVSADGMLIRHDPYAGRWDYFSESSQQAFIDYRDGTEKMILSISPTESTSSGMVWLFPIPANPQMVKIDVVKNLPEFSGEEISLKAKSQLRRLNELLQTTQLYTIPFIALKNAFFGVDVLELNGSKGGLGAGQAGLQTDVIVYEHLEKEGITTEIISAESSVGLYDYLTGKGLNIPSGSFPVLDKYIGSRNFSFVASWISSWIPEPSTDQYSPEDLYRNLFQIPITNRSINSRGVYVAFPSEKIYFPLLPTSVYGDGVIPITLRVAGFVSPLVYDSIQKQTKTQYYIDAAPNTENYLESFSQYPQGKTLKYTKIEINAPSNLLTEDLWMIDRIPLKTYYPSFVAQHPIIIFFLLLILISSLAGILAGLLVFKEMRNAKGIVKLGLIGLTNCLTFLAVFIATIQVSTKQKNEEIQTLLTQIRNKGYFWKRKLSLILLIFITPILAFGALFLPAVIREISDDYQWYLGHHGLFLIICYLLPLFLLVFTFEIKAIKPEDKPLFEQLKNYQYSSWTFQPKDKMKFVFVPLFSFYFLFLSWFVTKLIEFTV